MHKSFRAYALQENRHWDEISKILGISPGEKKGI